MIECNDELKKLREINQNLAQRNQRLELTRNYNFNKATDEYKTYNRDVNSRKLCTRDEVLQELKDLWRFKLSEEKSVLSNLIKYLLNYIIYQYLSQWKYCQLNKIKCLKL